MDNGKIVQLGTTDELLFRPANDFVRNFLKEEKTQLAFRSVKLSRLWSLLPDNLINTNADVTSIQSEISVWDAMDIFYNKMNSDEKLLNVVDSGTNQTKQINFISLMSAMNSLNKN